MSVRVRLAPALSPLLPASEEAAARHVTDLPAVRLLTRSRTTETTVVALEGAPPMVRKRWTWPGRGDRARGVFRTTVAARSPARREADALGRLRRLEGRAFAPEPLGTIEVRRGGVLHECTLLMREVEGAIDLARWLMGTPPGTERRDVIRRLAEATRRMHAAGLLDREMHPRNVLVVPASGDVMKVDCARQKSTGRPVPLRRAALDLAALDVGFERFGRRTERVRFLRTYLGPGAGRDEVRDACARVETLRGRMEMREAGRLPGT